MADRKLTLKGERLILSADKVSAPVILSLSRIVGSRCSTKAIPDINNPAATGSTVCSQWKFCGAAATAKAEIKSHQAISPAKALA
jgi:hypothetical protein